MSLPHIFTQKDDEKLAVLLAWQLYKIQVFVSNNQPFFRTTLVGNSPDGTTYQAIIVVDLEQLETMLFTLPDVSEEQSQDMYGVLQEVGHLTLVADMPKILPPAGRILWMEQEAVLDVEAFADLKQIRDSEGLRIVVDNTSLPEIYMNPDVIYMGSASSVSPFGDDYRHNPPMSEETWKAVLVDILDGGLNLSQASEKHGVPVSTISARLKKMPYAQRLYFSRPWAYGRE
jgi:hypothetical protein